MIIDELADNLTLEHREKPEYPQSMPQRKSSPAKKVVASSSQNSIEPYLQVWAWALLLWSLYRYFVHVPEWMDELVFKPLIFVGPVLIYVFKKEKKSWDSLGLTTKNIFRNLYIGLGLGMVFGLEGLLVHMVKHGGLSLVPIEAVQQNGVFTILILSLATAVTEEILTRGFLFRRIYEQTKSLSRATTISTLCFVLLHIPVLVLSLKFQGSTLLLFLGTNIILGIANSIIFYTTGSLLTPILVHAFWNMTVALYL